MVGAEEKFATCKLLSCFPFTAETLHYDLILQEI